MSRKEMFHSAFRLGYNTPEELKRRNSEFDEFVQFTNGTEHFGMHPRDAVDTFSGIDPDLIQQFMNHLMKSDDTEGAISIATQFGIWLGIKLADNIEKNKI